MRGSAYVVLVMLGSSTTVALIELFYIQQRPIATFPQRLRQNRVRVVRFYAIRIFGLSQESAYDYGEDEDMVMEG